MKNILNYIKRDESVLTGKKDLEPLYTLKDFPVYMGCVETPIEDDMAADMMWGVDPNGMIQLTKLLPLETLYLFQHNDGIGQVWQNHYRAFASFLGMHAAGDTILEIGGSHDTIAVHYLQEHPNHTWTIIEPHPGSITNPNVRLIQGWFDETTQLPGSFTTIVHSHVFEHTYQPLRFAEQIYRMLPVGGRVVFTLPNMEPMLAQKFTNCLNFEHTAFLTEPFVDYLLERAGFYILLKEYFGSPHSIFYAAEKRAVSNVPPLLPNYYTTYKNLFLEFVRFHEEEVSKLNVKIEESNEPVYLFGAHIFSQYLIQFGLKTSRVVSVLDNSPEKQGKRLYATRLQVESPKVLAGKGNANVILRAGIYNEEIKKDILENINPDVVFW